MTAPDRPQYSVPAYHGDTLDTEPYAIEWNHPTESLTAISDSLMISGDSLFPGGSIVENTFVTSTSYSVAHLANGDYFVRLKSVDAAGNESEYSQIRKFYLLKDE